MYYDKLCITFEENVLKIFFHFLPQLIHRTRFCINDRYKLIGLNMKCVNLHKTWPLFKNRSFGKQTLLS